MLEHLIGMINQVLHQPKDFQPRMAASILEAGMQLVAKVEMDPKPLFDSYLFLLASQQGPPTAPNNAPLTTSDNQIHQSSIPEHGAQHRSTSARAKLSWMVH